MANGNPTINISFGLLTLLLFALAFCGEPDLHDSLVKKAMQESCGKGVDNDQK